MPKPAAAFSPLTTTNSSRSRSAQVGQLLGRPSRPERPTTSPRRRIAHAVCFGQRPRTSMRALGHDRVQRLVVRPAGHRVDLLPVEGEPDRNSAPRARSFAQACGRSSRRHSPAEAAAIEGRAGARCSNVGARRRHRPSGLHERPAHQARRRPAARRGTQRLRPCPPSGRPGAGPVAAGRISGPRIESRPRAANRRRRRCGRLRPQDVARTRAAALRGGRRGGLDRAAGARARRRAARAWRQTGSRASTDRIGPGGQGRRWDKGGGAARAVTAFRSLWTCLAGGRRVTRPGPRQGQLPYENELAPGIEDLTHRAAPARLS